MKPVAWMFKHQQSGHTSFISPWEKKHYTDQKALGSHGGERWLKGEDAERHDIPLYTADQLRQAMVAVLRDAAAKRYALTHIGSAAGELTRMADELEKSRQ